MKKIIVLITILFSGIISITQAQFKYIPQDLSNAPNWAIEMYSENANFYEIQNLRTEFYQSNKYTKDIHERNFQHWSVSIAHLLDEDGNVLTDKVFPSGEGSSRGLSSPWYPIGPMDTYNLGSEGSFPVSWQANVFCMDVCQSNTSIVIAGIEGGDLFKTDDKGLNWYAISEGLIIRTPNAVKIAPNDPDVIFMIASNQLYKTLDGGNNWELMMSVSGSSYEIEIHPTDPNILFYSTTNGLFKSTDGGEIFTEVLDNKCWDVKYHPTDSQIVYALQHNNSVNRCEFFKSEDGGDTFSIQENGWYFPEIIGQAEDIGGKIGLTAAAPDQIYVSLIGASKDGDNGWIGLYKSEDSAASWSIPSGQVGGPYNVDTHQNVACFNPNGDGFHQGFYNFAMGVSQNDPDLLWIGCLALTQSSDGGENFERIGGYYTGPNDLGWIHPDCQDMSIVGDDIWIATDGGLNYSSDEMETHESRKNGIYNSTFWGFGQGWNQDIIVGGRYHNGNTGYIDTYNDNYYYLRLGGAEQATGYVNPILERKVYFSDITDHYLPETFESDKVFTSNSGFYPNESYFSSENSEIVYDPRYGKHLYMGRENKFWKSTNEGLSYELLYEFGTGSMVYEIEICRQNPNRIYASVRIGSNSRIYRSDDGGNSWEISPQDPGTSQKIEISVNPLNDDELWGIEVNSSTVFRTIDGGESWENMTTPTLFGHQMRDIQYQGGTEVVYVSSNNSVFFWNSEIAEWMDMGEGLPALMNVLETGIFYRDSKLRLVDGGKGVWETDLVAEASGPIVQAMTLTDVINCSRDTVLFDCYSILNHEDATWTWSFNPEPVYISNADTRNTQVVFGGNGVFEATLTVVDGNSQTGASTIGVEVISGCDVEPYSGAAIYCENDGDYASTVNFNRTTNEFTITAWIKPDGIQNDYTGIVMNNNISAGINFRGGNNTLGYHWPGGAWWWDSGLIVPDGEWSHVALVATPTGVTLYLNGHSVTHNATIEMVDINTMLIGSYQGWGGRNYNGKIDEVRIYNRSLDEAEIRELRHITLTMDQANDDMNLLAYYQFNEVDGDILDRSGVNHAYLGGASYREISEGPFGGGESDRISINSSGDYVLNNTETEIGIETDSPEGEIVVSRIHFNPNELAEGYLGYENFFVVNNYGDNQTWVMEDLLIKPFDFNPSAEVLAGDEDVILYQRPENSDLDDWVEICTSNEVTLDGIHFNNLCTINQNTQLFPITNEFVGIAENNSEPLIAIYPNPLPANGTLNVKNSSQEVVRFMLYDSKAKIIYSEWIQGDETLNFNRENIASGFYTFTIIGDSFIKSGNIIFQ